MPPRRKSARALGPAVTMDRHWWQGVVAFHQRWCRTSMVRECEAQMLASLPQSIARIEMELADPERRHENPLSIGGTSVGWLWTATWLLRVCWSTAFSRQDRELCAAAGWQIAVWAGGQETPSGEP